MPDIEIPCVQCKDIFVFTEKEQDIFYQRNMMQPQRCAKCRSKKARQATMRRNVLKSSATTAANTTTFRSSRKSDARFCAANVIMRINRE
jgi:hypothetical protein